MQQITVGTKYQIVIPKEIRKKIKSLKPGAKVSVYSVGENMVTIRTDPKSWVTQTRGLMNKNWAGIDPIAELEKMRNEWEHKS
ncbi:MAG: AbrB/MazE/SpoVT family DNA-binding domain-containing protein [Candidatus Curtissbacteria bacterium]